MEKGETLIQEYLSDTYGSEDRQIPALLKRHLSLQELRDHRWHVTVVSGRKAVLIVEGPEQLESIRVLGLSGKEALFTRKDQG